MNLSRLSYSVVALSSLLLAGCKITPDPKVTADATNQLSQAASMPAAVAANPAVPLVVQQEVLAESLRPLLRNEPRFNVNAQDVALPDFLRSLVADTPYSMVVHPEVSGRISLQLKQVTLAETLEQVRQLFGLDVRQSGSIFQVFPAALRTETIAVNYLMLQRQGLSAITVNSGGVSQNSNNQSNQNNRGNFNNNNLGSSNSLGNLGSMGNQQQFSGSSIQTENRTDFWRDLEQTLQAFLAQAPERMVVVSPQAGLVTVRAMPDEIAAIRAFLGQTEQHLQRQVVLEARIIEVTLNDDYQQGINWQNALASIRSTEFNLTTSGITPANALTAQLGGVTAISFNNADFNGVINLLQTQGNAQVLSSPRVTAMNNQKAVIKVGQDEYFVTDVTSNTTIAGTGATTTSPNISLQPFFSGIALDVTPQIDAQGAVILHVNPSVTETSEQSKTIRFSDETVVLPLAQSNIRQSDTLIRARSGEIVVIGGLMQTVKSDSVSRTPILGAIPGLGQLFTSKRQIEQKKELVILLKPTVVEPGVWQQQIGQSSEQLQRWQQGQ
ncbi:pilus (MSHA type) biogenesis protein MshL [Alishewanella sp. BS5-314]|uniref:pilus (MSHA type) biogenesis protein MshL n=1 Tax=Alishewanella sp. BS5-314 TaxID=2755587 RepID=UPI0021BB2590|nr:pilus (MSHA type) biogenesis protein MshL [Alishewanella sp. BS5-314]MCT8126361.1 pilus (MSHA type) biogenesis protein MshL [Alishewanella sp. BS5-314]